MPQPAVVVVDMTQIMRDAKAAKDIQSQVQKEMDAYSKEVRSRRTSSRCCKTSSSASARFCARRLQHALAGLQQRYSALDREVQVQRQAMQQSYNEAMTKVENAALQIIADIAKERKANMVMAKAALLYMADGLDMTAEVTSASTRSCRPWP